MKIITEHGQLDLPEDFNIKIERHNPLLSGEGDASVPATLPSSSHNLAVLGHRERVDRAYRYTNKMDAILQVGPITKRGQLLLDTVHRRDGIAASFAMDNSDLYVTSKEKSLKEIFNSYNNGAGYIRRFQTFNIAFQYLQHIYEVGGTDDFMIFPVAVSPYKSGNNTNYQYNNEINNDGNLVFGQREVHEGDIIMTVPMGYGVSPFLRLHRMLDILFHILGYEVTYNCFAKNDLKDIVIVNNCADTMVKLVILNYADMVPSCTLSEFLEWMNNKFHAQPFVNSESKEVKIVMMEDVLSGEADIDISGIVQDDFTVTLNPQKRVVLEPKITIEGTEAAADNFDELLKKYGGYCVGVNETEFAYIRTNAANNDFAFDCLILREVTGQFYILNRDLNTGNYPQVPILIGSNIIKYDRINSEEEESFKQDDLVPLMLSNGSHACPYIGERIHFHTGYNGQNEKAEQEIIVAIGVASNELYYKTTGTINSILPAKNLYGQLSLPFGLTPHEMYQYFWKRYNEMLLNNATHLKGKVQFDLNQFLCLDMSSLKLYKNQKLIQIQASSNIGNKIGVTESEFIITKSFDDGVKDTQPNIITKSPLKWELTDDIETVQEYYKNHVAYYYYENGVHYYSVLISDASSISYIDDLGLYWMGVPEAVGETHTITRKIRYTIHYWVYSDGTPRTRTETFDVNATVTFTAVTNP